MAEVAKTLFQRGAKDFFVANSEEGTELRSSIGGSARIFVLDGYSRDYADDFRRGDLIPCIADLNSLEGFIVDFPDGDYALHIETGLNRLALDDTAAVKFLANVHSSQPVLIMTHLACADDENSTFNKVQLDRLKHSEVCQLFPDTPLSLAGTEGILLGQRYRLDHVRPGIGLYCGGFGQITNDCLKIEARLISTKEIEAGESIGYAKAWTATRQMRTAALSMGYADGLPRTEREFRFFADGVECAVRGRVSMDIVNVDVTHLDCVPDKFELVGEHQSLGQLCQDFGEIPNTVITRFGACMTRRTVG